MAEYNYSIISDFPNQLVSATCLEQEIIDSSIVTSLDYIFIEEDDVSIHFSGTLTAGEETTLDGLVANHDNACSAQVSDDNSGLYYDALVALDGSGDYTSIADAFNDGNKTVFVKDGIYLESEDIIIPENGLLIGETPGSVFINFTGDYSVKVDGNGGTLENSGTITGTHGSKTITGSSTSFTNLSSGDYIKVCGKFYEIDTISTDTNLTLKYTYQGNTHSNLNYKALSMLVGIKIIDINVTGSNNPGIFIRAAQHVFIQNCKIFDCGDNTYDDNIHLEDVAECSVISVDAGTSKSSGILLKNCDLLRISSCVFSNNYHKGIRILNSNEIIMDGCTCNNNREDGINIEAASYNVNITDSIIICNKLKGINTDSGTGEAIIDSCCIKNNGSDGIDFDGDDNIINDCLIKNNGAIGIRAGYGGVITGNKIIGNNSDGIELSGGDDSCVISGNYIKGNGSEGIICAADHCIINANRVFDNTNEGIELTSASNDCIISNNSTKYNTGTNLLNNGTSNIVTDNET